MLERLFKISKLSKVVQSYNHEEKEKNAFSSEVEKAFDVAKKRVKHRSFLIAVVIFLTFSAISFMLWIGGMDVLSGKMSGGELGAFVFYAIMVAMSVATIAEVYGELQRAAGSATRLLELLKVISDITTIETPLIVSKTDQTDIEFHNVNFSYPSRPDVPALKNINLMIPNGKTVALVGPSGAGKTTMFELLQRFYDPQSGEVKLRNSNITQISLTDLRHTMGMVPQHPILFSSDVPRASPEIILEFTALTRVISFDDPITEYLLKNRKEGMKIINKPKKRTSERALFPILKIYIKNIYYIK